jgi:peptidoglycan/xylan/chitin deacetylase (PgdA/CDA1 family)
MDRQRYFDDVRKAQQAIAQVTGKIPHLFRPPGGYYNDSVVEAAKQVNALVVLWSWHQDTRDWRSPGVQAIVNKVLNNARNGDIVLFHDHLDGKSQTVEALKQILPELKARGYRFITVSDLLSRGKFQQVHN